MWTYNQIDVYASEKDNVLGETSVATNNWVPLSIYGLLRGRPTLTPSTVEGDSISIPGRDGTSYETDSSRGNAKLEFEVLVVDAWPYAGATTTVQERCNLLFDKIYNTKRIAYKEPGKDADSYYMVYKTQITITDAYKEAQTLKIQMEVYPFEFFLSGNAAITVAARSTKTITNTLPGSLCKPTYVFSKAGSGAGGSIYVGSSVKLTYAPPTNPDPTKPVVVDTFTEMAYYQDSYANANRYLSGDYSDLWVPRNTSLVIGNDFSAPMSIYLRNGIRR
jgi:phage-related protein